VISSRIHRTCRRSLAALVDLATAGRAAIPVTVTRVETSESVVALTFDDGPSPLYTPRLLEILERHQVLATFFMVGDAAQEHPDLVRQVAEKGHAIGNHSWDHPKLSSLRGDDRRRQIRACASALAPYGERLFRPPYGEQSLASRLDALWLGYTVITWDLDAEDWRECDPQTIAARIRAGVRPGSIVLLHDAIYRSRHAAPRYDRQPTIDAVEIVLRQLGDRYRFVTIPQLLRSGTV